MSKKWRQRRYDAYTFERTMEMEPGPSNVLFVGTGAGDEFVPLVPSADDVYLPYDAYSTSPMGVIEDAPVGTMGRDGTFSTYNENTYPGQYERWHAEWQDAKEYDPSYYPQLYIKDLVDYNDGGQFGLVDNLPYSTGVVSSDLVENFALTGEQATIRRDTDLRQMDGPVGTADYNGATALMYMQLVNQYYPNEASQGDLVGSV